MVTAAITTSTASTTTITIVVRTEFGFKNYYTEI